MEGDAVTVELRDVSFQCWLESQKGLHPTTDEIVQRVQAWCEAHGLPFP